MLSIQIDRAPQGGHFSAMNGKNNTTAVVLFLPQGVQFLDAAVEDALMGFRPKIACEFFLAWQSRE